MTNNERITQLQEDVKILTERIDAIDLVITTARVAIKTERAKLSAVEKELEGLVEGKIDRVSDDN